MTIICTNEELQDPIIFSQIAFLLLKESLLKESFTSHLLQISVTGFLTTQPKIVNAVCNKATCS